MPDPASGMERREFGGLVGLVEMAWLTHCNYGGDIEHCNDAREDLYRWHLDAVERAVREELANAEDTVINRLHARATELDCSDQGSRSLGLAELLPDTAEVAALRAALARREHPTAAIGRHPMIWEQGHRLVTADEFTAWRDAYPRPLTLEVHESRTGYVLHMYLDAEICDLAGRPRCAGSMEPPTGTLHGPIYRIHGEHMTRAG